MTSATQPISLFSTIAVKKALAEDLCDAFTRQTGIAVDAVYEPTNALLERIAAGARPDVMIGVTHQLPPLGQSGVVDQSTCTPVAKVRVGIAAAADFDADITTVHKLITTLTTARSVAYSRAGASGLYFAGLLERLGIAEQVNAQATIVESGFAAAAVVTGKADIAVQLMSEHRCVPEAKILGPLPEEVQQITEFSAVLGHAAATRPEAQAFIEFLTSNQAHKAYSLTGVEAADTSPTNHHDPEAKVPSP